MNINDYTIEEHQHRYAVWTSARAASRSRLKNTEVEYLINQVKLRQEVDQLRRQSSLNDTSYREWLRAKGEEIVTLVKYTNWSEFKSNTFNFGLAAKIISIYIKTVEVLPTNGASLLAQFAHPPIDGILLKNINSKHHLKLKTNWSTFDWDQYESVTNQVFAIYHSVPKWKIEVEWNISNEETITSADFESPQA